MKKNKIMTWDEAKAGLDKLERAITDLLDKKPPKTIADVLIAVKKIDKNCWVLPNPNKEGKYIQLILYPSAKWKTWSETSMSISKYNLCR